MNKEKLKGFWEKIKTTLGKISKKIWILIAAVVLVLTVVIVIFVSKKPYATLITGASADEAGAVVTWLDAQGFRDYRMEGTGTILVPEGQASNLKAKLLMEQYTSKTSPYSFYFEQIGALSTQSDRNNAWLTALTEEMQETIQQFEGVRYASVTINEGEDLRYILDTDKVVKASVGVMLTMENGKTLTNDQANAIRNYISHSVAGVDFESVSINDTAGHEYGLTNGDYTGLDATALKFQMEREWEEIIRQHVLEVLEPVYGKDNLGVTANVVVEVGDTTIEEYKVGPIDPSIEGSVRGEGIIGSRVYSYQFLTGEELNAGGVPGTSTNSDINLPTYVEQDPSVDDNPDRWQGSGEINYKYDESKTYTVKTAAYISDCTVSVSINTTTAGTVDVEQVRSHVARAAGINGVETETMTAQEYLAGKISVFPQPFWDPNAANNPNGETPTGPEGIPSLYLWIIIGVGVALLLIAIIVIVILRIRKKRRLKKEAEEQAVQEFVDAAALEEGAGEETVEGEQQEGADVMELHTERSMELRQNIRDFVDENMEVAALLIRDWLRGDEDHG